MTETKNYPIPGPTNAGTIPGTDNMPIRTPLPQKIITYPYPPFVQIEDGTYCEMPDIYTLVKLVYSLRERVNELEKEREE